MNSNGKDIVHRELKSANILAKGMKAAGVEIGYAIAKVANFGLPKTKKSSSTYSKEGFEARKYNPRQADIHAFAMTHYETISDYEPLYPIRTTPRKSRGEY
jgi:serine/threonine protein kinase